MGQIPNGFAPDVFRSPVSKWITPASQRRYGLELQQSGRNHAANVSFTLSSRETWGKASPDFKRA